MALNALVDSFFGHNQKTGLKGLTQIPVYSYHTDLLTDFILFLLYFNFIH